MSTADVEVTVTSISHHGLWVDLAGTNVRWPSPDHLHWPDLDIDLSVESIEHPERFPLHVDPAPSSSR